VNVDGGEAQAVSKLEPAAKWIFSDFSFFTFIVKAL